MSRDLLDQRQLVDGLRIVGDRPVAVHRDGYGTHAQEAEGHQAEGEDCRRLHELLEPAHRADPVGNSHQAHDGDPEPVGRKVSGHKTREDVE